MIRSAERETASHPFGDPDACQVAHVDVDVEVDVEAAATAVARTCFTHAGQGAARPARIVVHATRHEAFLASLLARAAELADEALAAVPPLRDHASRERVIALVDDAWTRGAEVHQFGRNEGLFHPATVLTGVAPGMHVLHATGIGPVAAVIQVDSVEEAVALSSCSDSGRTLLLWDEDPEREAELIAAMPRATTRVNRRPAVLRAR